MRLVELYNDGMIIGNDGTIIFSTIAIDRFSPWPDSNGVIKTNILTLFKINKFIDIDTFKIKIT